MANKLGTDTFTSKWNKTVGWAKQNNIPYAAYYPVYQLDAKRFLSGTPMSEAEITRAIQAAQGLSVSTALPTDVPNSPASPVGELKNIRSNAANIFTGLEPWHLASSVFDTVTNTVEHPSSVYGFFTPQIRDGAVASVEATLHNMAASVLGPHSLLAWVPGTFDAAQLIQNGKGGAEFLAANPITALLDILPLGRAVPSRLAAEESGVGAAIAGRLGVSKDALAKMDSIQMSYRLLKTLPMPLTDKIEPSLDAAGNPTGIRRMTIGSRMSATRNLANIGKEQADLGLGAITTAEEGTRKLEKVAGPAIEALGSLNTDMAQMAIKALATDFRPESEILSDPKYPDPVKGALEKVYEYVHYDHQIKMQAGDVVNIQTQFGIETYSTRPGSSGKLVFDAQKRSLRDEATLHTAAKPYDELLQKTQITDKIIQGSFNLLHSQQDAIYSSIRSSEPGLAGISHTIGEHTKDVLWQKIVETQSPLVRNLLGLPPGLNESVLRMFPSLAGSSRRLTLHDANNLRDLFSPEGLLAKMHKAYEDQDWHALSRYSKAAVDKFNNKSFKDIPTSGANAFLHKTRQMTEQLYKYATGRERDMKKLDSLRIKKIIPLSKRAHESHQHFLKMALEHPPDVWRNAFLDEYVKQITDNEKGAEILDKAAKAFIKSGKEESEVDKLRADPRTLVELVVRTSKNSLENPMLPDIDVALSKSIQQNAYEEIASLRARGFRPTYIPMLSVHDIPKDLNFNVHIGSLKARTPSATFDRVFDFNSSIYDVQAAILESARQEITRDVTHEFVTNYVKPMLIKAGDLQEIVSHYKFPEIAHHSEVAQKTGIRQESVDSIVLREIKNMGYDTYDPQALFGPLTAAHFGGDFYIQKDVLSALDKTINKFQFPAEGVWNKGTKIFRFSILGLSLRYTAHILFGGTALVAYRGHASMFRQLRAGWHVFTTGKLPDDVLAKYPHAERHMTNAATQEGEAEAVWHRATAYTFGNKAIQEFLDNHQMARTALNWTTAAANINMRFTRAVVRAQRAVVYLDGAARAEKEGSFTEPILTPRIDPATGQKVTHPQTGNVIYDETHRKSEMTSAQAHEAGMRAVAEVMGELRHMTPLERSLLVRVFPFYGWTKHVLTYVLTYPIDHPYRAMFLSYLAEMNSIDQASGLPTRLQLLMFLGHPDEFGNVSAVDAKFMDPLRDTANYASMSGLFQSLNPILSAPMSYVDPQISFGANEVYPHLTYSQLYGVKEAGPQGTPLTVAEQFVPQLSAIDAAFNLSGQYGYLKKQGGDAFANKVFQSLNIPFFHIQHINLRQIAAQQELDRYSIAANDAYQAASTGDMKAISGYPSTAQLPDPLNVNYNVTPAYIEALTRQSESTTGLPFTETTKKPRNPAL